MIDIVEYAAALVRASGAGALCLYYLGAMPFVALFILYFADMSIMACDASRLVLGSLLLGLFFLWMKVWQAVYACRLWDTLQDRCGTEKRHWFRLAARQAFLQPFGLFMLPLALLALIPYGAVHAYCQNVTVLDRGADMKVRELSREARTRALEEPRQAFLLVWAISPLSVILCAALVYLVTPLLRAALPEELGFLAGAWQVVALILLFPLSPLPVIVAANVLMALTMGPQLLHALLGVSSAFLENRGIWSDALAFVAVAGIVYLLLDPLVKAAFVLRCFRSEAAHTGEDLRVELRRTRSLTAGLLMLAGLAAVLLSAPAARAAEPATAPAARAATVTAGQLDGQLEQVFKQRSYAWRIPGEKDLHEMGAFGAFVEGVGRTLIEWSEWAAKKWHKIGEWLDGIFGSRGGSGEEPGGINAFDVHMTLLVLLVLLICIAVVLYVRRRRAGQDAAPMAAVPLADAKPDVNDENTLATDLQDDEWARMAEQLAAQGEYRGALRASFLSMLAWLAAQNFVRVARAKSNREYGTELERRAHARPDCLAAFRSGVSVFEPVWYGAHPATAEQVGQIMNLGERLRHGELV